MLAACLPDTQSFDLPANTTRVYAMCRCAGRFDCPSVAELVLVLDGGTDVLPSYIGPWTAVTAVLLQGAYPPAYKADLRNVGPIVCSSGRREFPWQRHAIVFHLSGPMRTHPNKWCLFSHTFQVRW